MTVWRGVSPEVRARNPDGQHMPLFRSRISAFDLRSWSATDSKPAHAAPFTIQKTEILSDGNLVDSKNKNARGC